MNATYAKELSPVRLFVDDLRQAPKGWVLARTITEAIRILDDFAVEEVSLDHDIVFVDERGQFTGKTAAEDFTPVARFIRRMPLDFQPKRILIHTANPTGALALALILEDANANITRVCNFVDEWEYEKH